MTLSKLAVGGVMAVGLALASAGTADAQVYVSGGYGPRVVVSSGYGGHRPYYGGGVTYVAPAYNYVTPVYAPAYGPVYAPAYGYRPYYGGGYRPYYGGGYGYPGYGRSGFSFGFTIR